jgi:hypothetical protein
VELPVWEPGVTIVAEERWHGMLWSAVPQRVVRSTPTELATYVPTGAVATRASNRGLPSTEGLSLDQRKLLALRTRESRVVEVAEAPDKIFITRPERWSRTILGWDQGTGAFRGWYVNFELPVAMTSTGLASMDLVLDLWVNPDRTWVWKDRDEYLSVLADRTLDPAVRDHLELETGQVLEELKSGVGPFADTWMGFRSRDDWPTPMLPSSHAWGGEAWSLPMGERLSDAS